MPRSIWKGAISFGLVHIPVSLYPASSESGVDFDWIDKRTMDPVGYKRVNKRTGKEVAKEQIARGVKVGDGDYVVLGDDEIKAAYPRTTQTIDIETFVKAGEVPFTQLENPYFLEPAARGEKVYALLREAMRDAGVIGIARLVMRSKEHLAALVPMPAALMLVTLRWADEIRGDDALSLPAEGRRAAGIKDAELAMARRLIDDMTEAYAPERYGDRFADAIRALVEQRAAAGRTERVQPMEEPAQGAGGNVVDLTELLARSLDKPRGKSARSGGSAKPSPRKRA